MHTHWLLGACVSFCGNILTSPCRGQKLVCSNSNLISGSDPLDTFNGTERKYYISADIETFNYIPDDTTNALHRRGLG